jgi:hypothetical protein
MHSPAAPLFLALGLLAVLGCGTDPIGGVTATTDKTLYEVGQPIDVEIVNTSDQAVNYYACPERWDHKTSSGYERIEELGVCLAIVTSVPAGGSVHVTYSFPDGQPLGTWRIPIPVSRTDASHVGEIHTADFEVVVFEN